MISQATFVSQSLKLSIVKFFHFPLLKLYQNLKVFKLTKGTPHTGLTLHTESHQPSSGHHLYEQDLVSNTANLKPC